MNNESSGMTMLKYLSLFLVLIMLSLLVVSCSTIKRPEVAPDISHYQITNVNVVDVINKIIRYNSRVEVKQGRIVAVVAQSEMPYQQHNIKTIDGKDKFLIPGLWDNHSTLLSFSTQVDYPLYIANGVTSIRSNLSCPNEDEVSVYACMKDKAKWKEAVATDELLGPNLHGWGTYPINGNGRQHPDLPDFHNGSTVEQVKKLVEHYAAYPADQRPFFIKTYNWIPEVSYLALSQYAKEKGFELAGHMPRSMQLKDVIDAGQRSIAHARLFIFDCSFKADELRAGKHRKTKLKVLYPWLIKNFDEQACQQKYQYMASKGVFLNPTLMTRRNDYYGVAGLYHKMQGLDYAHYLFTREWEEDIAKHGDNLSDDTINAFRDFYHLTAKTIVQAHKAGVKVLAGTDSWSEYNVPGFCYKL
jgi:hypothetical protein